MIASLLALALLAWSPPQAAQPDALDKIVRELGAVRPQTPAERAAQERRKAAMIACRRAYVGQDYLPQPAIWKIADADTSVYLLGTFHRLPLNFDWRSAQLDRIIVEAQLLVTETSLPGDGGSFERGKELIAKIASTSRPSIAQRVTGERRAKWLGMSALMPDATVQMIDSMPNWLAAIVIGMTAEIARTPPTSDGADRQLQQLFQQAGKPVQAIEEADAVLAGVNAMAGAQQDRMLDDALDAVGRSETLAERMAPYHAWARGEHRLNRYWADANRGSYAQTLRERLLFSRNAAWADELRRRMTIPGVILVAVGAGHLDGRNSLFELLAARGLRPERVSPVTPPMPRPAFSPKPAKWSDCNNYLFGARAHPGS